MLSDLKLFLETALLAALALLPIVNPLGGAPIYLAKTVDLTPEQHGELARRVALNCGLLLLGSLLLGAYVLDFFGLSIPTVQVAGGLVVCSIAWSLLQAPDEAPPLQDDARRELATSADLRRRAFYPLTMPLTVGPGSISVAIALGANQAKAVHPAIVIGIAHVCAVAIVAVAVFVCYRYADRILRRLGDTGTIVVMRMSAFILLCIGVQILWNGVSALLKG
ncbi:MAG TPA: MarC family protein [Casimicrobiaceae bacterium]|jgi:multiple antibiotic resistance protein